MTFHDPWMYLIRDCFAIYFGLIRMRSKAGAKTNVEYLSFLVKI